jgi:hypothetical protein
VIRRPSSGLGRPSLRQPAKRGSDSRKLPETTRLALSRTPPYRGGMTETQTVDGERFEAPPGEITIEKLGDDELRLAHETAGEWRLRPVGKDEFAAEPVHGAESAVAEWVEAVVSHMDRHASVRLA